MLRQGTNRLNQGHGSDGSGWGSERTGLMRAWWMLTEGSIRAAALAAEAECRQGSGGSTTALTETGMQGLWSRRQWKLSSSRNNGGSDTGAQSTATAWLGEEEGKVTIWPTPLPCIYRT